MEQSIQRLNISDETIRILRNNEVKTINQLCDKTKIDLAEFEINKNEIELIQDSLEQEGLRLSGCL